MDPALLAAEKVHNIYRKKHGASPLQLDAKLNEEALKQAKSIVTGQNKSISTKLGRNEYESIEEDGSAESSMREGVAKAAVSEWYSNMSHYNWDSPLMSHHSALLFTQIIWKSTTHLGIGIASKGAKFVVVALYEPAGNSAGEHQHRDNVQKALW